MLQHPFQCLAVARPPGANNAFVLAACGAKLISTSLEEGAALAIWSSGSNDGTTAGDTGEDFDERPAKKQKTASTSSASNVIKLSISPNNHHAVVVTEDKIVRVFDIGRDGTLVELSQRAMPKRPCAIEILPDNATILCGDKFGDVYSLPLLPEEKIELSGATTATEVEQTEKKAQAFKPSATNATVHTKRNRQALEAQLKQKNLTAKTKEPLQFEHKLLLGHVSMLTDLAFATREVDGKQRRYIITADRDEHIRVSRGPPQSHIIEGYCLGHTEFVSKVCLVPDTDLLVSGGGDSWIGVWHWPSFKLMQRLDVLEILREGLKRDNSLRLKLPSNVDNMNISGIYIVPMKVGELISQDDSKNGLPVTEPAVVVACEGIPSMLVCPAADLLTTDAGFQPITLFSTPVLDITSYEEVGIATFDERKDAHKRVWSFRLARDKKSETSAVQFFGDVEHSAVLGKLDSVNAEVKNEKALDSLLYGVANLRKRGYHNDEDGGEAEPGLAGGAENEGEARADEAD